ncbi:hypothetical protein J437_LFUL017477 [Ladona fulva]|uniref:DNA-directed DNA polymerase n=1 Tax=Ladona fulva TaxID=123851 RepID=A0A8K0KSD7_LADFU|nr:hypothetical protein J437_LFUL017477 [Ladona fulva]
MIHTLDEFRNRKFCKYCEINYSTNDAIQHENTNTHRTNAVNQLGRGFAEIESAINSRLKTFWITNDEPAIDMVSFLEKIKNKVVEKLNNQILTNNAIKFNVVLICKFQKGENDELDASFKTENKRVLCNDDVVLVVEDSYTKLLKEKSEFQAKGSGWALSEVVGLELRINKYTPLRGSTYINLPVKIIYTKSVVNVKNNDAFCFKYAIWAKNIDKDPQRVSKYDTRSFNNGYRWDCIEYPVDLKDVIKFERANNITINMFGLDEKNNVYPLKIVDCELEDHRDLLYITNQTTAHYCWIKNFTRLISSQLTRHRHYIHICKRCMMYYQDETRLEEHKELCRGTGEPSKIVLPDEMNNTLKFTHLNYSFRVPCVIYADFECLLENVSSCEPSLQKSFTNVIQKHTPFSFCYMVITPDGCQSPYLYRGANAERVFIQRMKDEAEKIFELYKKPVPMELLTPEEESMFRMTELCFICGKKLNDGRVRDHDHLTGRFRGVAHKFCNLQYKMPNFLPVFIHNLSSYDSHFIVRELDYDDRKIFVIPNSEEKYISFAKSIENNFSIRFIDTYRFMPCSLASLVSNLSSHEYTTQIFSDRAQLVARKGVYPYDYTDSLEKLDECFLPSKEMFFNALTGDNISDMNYLHAQNVWESFECKTLGNYSDVYLKSDVTLLADVFENFRDVCFGAYRLDPAWYYTAPGLTFDAMLRHTEIELELLTDYDMILMIEKGIRGGISQCCKRYVEANNKYMEEYDPKSESRFLSYLDANNLYGRALSRPLPYANFRWLSSDEIRDFSVNGIPEYNEKGYILEVDLEYPTSLHDEHSDLPLCPENKAPPGNKHKKLLTTLEDKIKYTIHYVNLKQALSFGLQLKKIHRVLEFSQLLWLKSYINLNTERRKLANNDFEKDFYKLMNNAVFDKTMENVRKRMNLELVTSEKRLEKLINKTTFLDRTIFNESLVAVHLRKVTIKMNKPIYIGFCILDLSKTLMYNFHYQTMLPKYGKNLSLAYTDTDSLIYSVKTDDLYKDMLDNLDTFDTSNYPQNHMCYSVRNKKVIGKFKDDCDGKVMTHFIRLRSKLYSFKVEGGKEKKKAKGITKAIKEKSLNFDDYVRCLHEKSTEFRKMNVIRSKKHELYTMQMNKDECDGKVMTHFIGLRSKLYLFEVEGGKDKKKAKGITKAVKEKSLNFDDYVRCLHEKSTEFRKMNVIRSKKHELYTMQMNKVTLNAFDDKRYIYEDGINTLAWGHYKIPRKRTHDEAFPET